MVARAARWGRNDPVRSRVIGFAVVVIGGTATSLVLGDGVPWPLLLTGAAVLLGAALAAHVTERWARLRWRSRRFRFRYLTVLALVWLAYAVLFTLLDEGDVGFGLIAGGVIAMLAVTAGTVITLIFGRPDRGWYLRR